MQTSPTAVGDASMLAALNAFTLKGSAYKETLRKKLDDKRDKGKAAVAASPEGLYAILKSLKTVRARVTFPPSLFLSLPPFLASPLLLFFLLLPARLTRFRSLSHNNSRARTYSRTGTARQGVDIMEPQAPRELA